MSIENDITFPSPRLHAMLPHLGVGVDTFGIIKLPGPFRHDIEEISTGFEEAVASRIRPFCDV
jgi:hypothetical protein